jgi:hypothetical protein
MREDLDKLLCEKYPKIFKDRNAPMTVTAMCWGFPGDGWFNIIDMLCGAIQYHIDNVTYWKDGVESHCPQVVATQVKEKYGALRFYYCGGDDTIDGMVDMAEYMSKQTCEECGLPGVLRAGGWVRTLCGVHAKVRENG